MSFPRKGFDLIQVHGATHAAHAEKGGKRDMMKRYVRLLLAVTFFLLAIAGFIEVYL